MNVTELPRTAAGEVVLATPATIPAQPADEPHESWSNETLLNCGRESLEEGDRLEAQSQPLMRQSISSRMRGGHALSILRARLRAEGRWTGYQQENALPRTTVWQVIEVYERATADGHSARDLAKVYGTWTAVLLAYGLAKPRRNKAGGCVVEPLEPPEESDDSHDEDFDDDLDDGDGNGDEEPDDDGLEDGEPDDEGNREDSGAKPQELEPEPLPVTDEQIGAAEVFVGAVGGLVHAVRVLLAKGVSGGDKEAVKDALAEAFRAARAVLTPSEISEVVIVDSGKAKGINWMAV